MSHSLKAKNLRRSADRVKFLADKLYNSGLGIEPIQKEDNKTFYEFFKNDARKYNYANSWFYLTQAVNGVNKHQYEYGFKLEKNGYLFAIGVFYSKFTDNVHFHIVNPTPFADLDKLSTLVDELAGQLYRISGTPVYIKKINGALKDSLRNKDHYKTIDWKYGKLSPYSWHKKAPVEDDSYPEVVINIKKAWKLYKGKSGDIRWRVDEFEGRYGNRIKWENVTESNQHNVIEGVVHEFFRFKRKVHIDISEPEDYFNMVLTSPRGEIDKDYIKRLCLLDGKPIAFLCTERIGNTTCHGLYSNLCLYQNGIKSKPGKKDELEYLSQYVIVEAMKHLKDIGITHLNMGGSENEGLNEFKKKFMKERVEDSDIFSFHHLEKHSYWLVYDEKAK